MSRTTCSTEKPSVSRVNLSAVSHTLRAALDRARTSMPMPLCWMPWPGKAYTVFGRGQLRGRRHHQIGADARGDLDDLCAAVDSDAVDAEVDLVAGQHHAEEARRSSRPAGQAGRACRRWR